VGGCGLDREVEAAVVRAGVGQAESGGGAGQVEGAARQTREGGGRLQTEGLLRGGAGGHGLKWSIQYLL